MCVPTVVDLVSFHRIIPRRRLVLSNIYKDVNATGFPPVVSPLAHWIFVFFFFASFIFFLLAGHATAPPPPPPHRHVIRVPALVLYFQPKKLCLMCVCDGKKIHVLMKTLLLCNLLDALRGIFYYCNDLFFTHPLFVVVLYIIIIIVAFCRGLIIKRVLRRRAATLGRGSRLQHCCANLLLHTRNVFTHVYACIRM